ncbi:PREDICTED: putative FBD-associated F-box protein At5g53635 [Camelina sativa]|uniref:FBD-associated F-box protein At5g53635 n=1 Tax=Camelina sativa TaxID=90675 RepID=A0ABM0WPK4_CAMSA|nr:PREDICTED: putative FBD-associated F-box protein At5g53635 [Camelina sativa]
MVGRERANRAYRRGLGQRLKEDRINQLPDHLICHILSHLPPQDSVKTSVLTKRWRSLWHLVLSLEVVCWNDRDFNALMSFGDSFFDSNRISYIHDLKLTINKSPIWVNEASQLTSWIDAAVKRKMKHLDLKFDGTLPISLYTCETLVSLKLCLVKLPKSEFVSLPCLKTMHLTSVWNHNDENIERLVSSCPVLEELEIKGRVLYDATVIRVLSRALKKISIESMFYLSDSGSGIVIDAPQLHFLNIGDNLPESIMITNMDSNAKLVLRIPSWCEASNLSSQRNRLHSFLPQISNVKDMSIHQETLQVSYDDSAEGIMNHFSFLPQCLLSSLGFVDLKVRIWGLAAEMELVRHFLENSANLKKLALPLYYDALQIQDDFVKKLLKIPTLSTECEVVFL